MRWGVREEAQDDHMTSGLCMKEIHKCQRISVGPTFVVSTVPLPAGHSMTHIMHITMVSYRLTPDCVLYESITFRDQNTTGNRFSLALQVDLQKKSSVKISPVVSCPEFLEPQLGRKMARRFQLHCWQ